MNKVTYGLHTAEVKRMITHREADKISLLFQNIFPDEANGCRHFFNEGINNLWITDVVNKSGIRKCIHMRVNFTRAIGMGEHCLMPYTTANVKKVIKNITGLLKQLKLNPDNADFGGWSVERFDSAFDIEISCPELYMALLDRSLDVKAQKRRCSRKPFTPANPNVCESIRFGNDSYTYNIYIKLSELLNNGIVITPEILQEVENIIRIERQNLMAACKQLLPTRTMKDLASKDVCNKVLKTMIDDTEVFWGKGSYYSSGMLTTAFDGNEEVKGLIKSLVAFTRESLEANYDLYTPDVKAVYQNYGILPTGILQEDETKYQIGKLESVYDMVTAHYTIKEKRPYHAFAVPHVGADGRYKANITVHKVNQTKPTVSVAARTRDEYEEKVWKELMAVYVTNVKYHCSTGASIPDLLLKSMNDILRYRQVVKSKKIKAEIDEFIKRSNPKNNTSIATYNEE